jgi:hypothetical protein
LEAVLDGEIDPLIDELALQEQSLRLQEAGISP